MSPNVHQLPPLFTLDNVCDENYSESDSHTIPFLDINLIDAVHCQTTRRLPHFSSQLKTPDKSEPSVVTADTDENIKYLQIFCMKTNIIKSQKIFL